MAAQRTVNAWHWHSRFDSYHRNCWFVMCYAFYMDTQKIHWSRRSYTEEEFLVAWDESTCLSDVLRRLGLPIHGGNINTLKRTAEILGLSREHFTGISSLLAARTGVSTRPLEEILVENSTYSNSSSLKKRLIKSGLLEKRCHAPFCPTPIERVNGFSGEVEPTRLALDHINGRRTDNRLDNLRLLCYDCHGQTDTWCGKQLKKVRTKKAVPISKRKRAQRARHRCAKNECPEGTTSKNGFCLNHYLENKKTLADSKYLDIDTLLEMVRKYGYSGTGKILGVSDNGIRKHLKTRGVVNLPRFKKN